jgi:hypothetical protein
MILDGLPAAGLAEALVEIIDRLDRALFLQHVDQADDARRPTPLLGSESNP